MAETEYLTIHYGLNLNFSGLSLRRVSERLISFPCQRNCATIWNWSQKYPSQDLLYSKRKILEYIVDKTPIKAGSEYI